MKLKTAAALLLASITMATTPATTAYAALVYSGIEQSNAKIYTYNDGLFIRLLDTEKLYGAEITITFADDLDDAKTQFQSLPSTTLKFANVSGNEMKILIEDSRPITYDDELDVAFIQYPTDTIVESVYVKMIYANRTEKFSVSSTLFTNETYYAPPTSSFYASTVVLPGSSEVSGGRFPTPEVSPEVAPGYIGPNPNYPIPHENVAPGVVLFPTPEVTPEVAPGYIGPNPNYPIPHEDVAPGVVLFPTPEVTPDTPPGYIGPNPNYPIPHENVTTDGFFPTPELPPGYIGPNISNPSLSPGLGPVYFPGEFPTPEVTYDPHLDDFDIQRPSTSGRITTVSIDIENENVYKDYAITHIPNNVINTATADVMKESNVRGTIPKLSIDVDSHKNSDKVSVKFNSNALVSLLSDIDSVFEMETNLGTFNLDFDAIDGLIHDADDKDVVLTIANEDAIKANSRQADTLKGNTAYEIIIETNSKEITEFDSEIAITLDYSLPYGHDRLSVTAYAVDKYGNLDEVKSVYYSSSEKIVIYSDELSIFMIDSNR
ncbi:hypothetical protein [Candidatus Epulonipiscium viviparus]|uniref:hypothetical protein n=1 Tax=Candidatus Epulonipiscium viviparus TaxID=420336 RepID=UPI00016C072D|nr:hypothetical protein [Candidatus Epulopiscium viviparus]